LVKALPMCMALQNWRGIVNKNLHAPAR
jgi:hypothetical protein